MRIIKFRVWDGTKYCIEPRLDVSLLNSEPNICYIAGFGKTIQQFTGLLDKNGREIYEGDIVDTIYDGVIGKIAFDLNTCAFRIMDNKNKLIPIITYRFINKEPVGLLQVAKTIIGNIFENPDLIK